MNTHVRRFRRATALLMLAGLAGCGLGSTLGRLGTSAGGGLVTGARTQLASDSTTLAIRRLTDSATLALADGIRGNLQPALNSTLAGAFGSTSSFVRGTQDSLALFVAGPLSSSLERLIRGNVQTFGTTLDAQLDPIFTRAGEGLRGQLALTLDQAGGDARRVLLPLVGETVDTLSARLAVNARGPLRQAIDSIVSSAVTSGIRAADAESRPLLNRISGVLMGVAGVLVLGALIWMNMERKRSEQALFAIGEAVKMTDDESVREAIKDRIKTNARRRQIDGYLHTFLEKNQLLRGSEQPAKVNVGKVVRGDPAEEPVAAGEPPRL